MEIGTMWNIMIGITLVEIAIVMLFLYNNGIGD